MSGKLSDAVLGLTWNQSMDNNDAGLEATWDVAS